MTPSPTSPPQPKPPFPKQELEPPGEERKMDPRPRYKAAQYRGSGKLLGEVALITGGDSGIGRAVAVLFAREGAQIAFTHLPEEETDAQETIEAVRQEGQEALAFAGDVRDDAFCRSTVEETVRHFGRLDILLHFPKTRVMSGGHCREALGQAEEFPRQRPNGGDG